MPDNARTIFVSNRLAVRVSLEDGEISYVPSVGGLATGLSSVSTGSDDIKWVGWSGLAEDTLTPEQSFEISTHLRDEHGAITVPISSHELELFYAGFCNDTIWPLFHYFPTYAEYSHESWDAYRRVNERFFAALEPVMTDDAIVWVHDYQLMLLPGLIKAAYPNARVGFFLHIPFPSFEIFRLLPWREAVLEGMLGADLIGFHTYDYARHFLSSVRRLAGYDHAMGVVQTSNRAIKVDVFPMGIDFDRYAGAGTTREVRTFLEELTAAYHGKRLVLSVDRLDYSKGIPTRVRAFGRFLELFPDMHGKVSLLMIVSPSRESVPRYLSLKREIDGLVSEINGRFSSFTWTPILYRYQTASFAELNALYRRADTLLVTPLRDGMNLIAKEYIAARTDERGAIVLSETAGVARELSEAIEVNPSDVDGIAQAIHHALEIDDDEQQVAIAAMRKRVQRYTVQFWAQDFLHKLADTEALQASFRAEKLTEQHIDALADRWKVANRRLLFLDYDGTLMRFFKRPGQARPDKSLEELIDRLEAIEGLQLVVSSGRDRDNLESWFGKRRIGLGAGHGAWIRDPDGTWEAATMAAPHWKEDIGPIIQRTVDRTPGSAIEEKAFSLAWHYRNSEPELAQIRLAELRDTLIGMTSNLELSVLDGNRVLEVKPVNINKGRVVQHFASHGHWDLIAAIGDDATDEFMFQALPDDAVSIKVGVGTTAARYSIDGVPQVRELLERLAAST